MPSLKCPASTRVVRQSGYRTPFQFFLALFLSGNSPSIWRLRLNRSVSRVATSGARKYSNYRAVQILFHSIRGCIERRPSDVGTLDTLSRFFTKKVWYPETSRCISHNMWGFGLCGTISDPTLFGNNGSYRTAISIISTIVDPFVWDIAVALLTLAVRSSDDPDKGPLIERTFIHHYLHVLNHYSRFDSLPWNSTTSLAATTFWTTMVASIVSNICLWFCVGTNSRQTACCFAWSMEGQDEVKADTFDAVVGEGQGDA